MSHFELITLGIFDIFAYLFLTLGFLKKEKIIQKNKAYFCIFAFINLAFITLLLPREYTFLFNFISFYLGTYLFLKRKWLDSLLILAMNVILQVFLPFPYIIISNLLFMDVQTNFTLLLIMQSLFLAIFYLIYKKAGLDIIWDYIIRFYQTFLVIIINMMLIGFSIIVFYSLDVERFVELIIFFLTISLVVLSVNIVLIHQAIKSKNQEEMIRKQREYQDVILSLVEEIKLVQHEYDNHIQGLQMALTEDNQIQQTKIRNYMKDIEQKQWFSNILKTANPVLMGVLISKYRKALEKNIDFEVNNHSLEMEIPVKDYELTEMMGILTDNAVQNTQEGGHVVIVFHKDGFSVKNSYEYLPADQVNAMFKKGYSTNGTLGAGLYNLRKIVEKYTGEVEVYNEKTNDVNYIVFQVAFS